MKTLSFMLLFLPQLLLTQPNFNAVVGAIQKGDIASLSQHLDNEVELVINDDDGTYNKSQATNIIQKFLTTNKPSNCSIANTGAARNNGSYYLIGKLTAGGQSYRVNIFFKEVSGKYLIQEMRIEED
jgi:hypothetical protein